MSTTPPKRGRGGRRGRGRGGRTAHQRDDSPPSPDAARSQLGVRTCPHPGPLVCSRQSFYSQQTGKQLPFRPSLTSWPGYSLMPGSSRPQPPGIGRRTARRCSGRPPQPGPMLQAPVRAHHNRAPATGSSHRPARGYLTRQLILECQPDSFPRSRPKATARQLSPRHHALQVSQPRRKPKPPSLQE